jgi:predicted branched-subunit amino acid permease
MAVCKFQGNGDMYGLGIRLGYYFQWFGAIFAAWLAPSEVNPLRFSIDVFVAASFLALIIITVQNVDTLQPIETYIVLLLMFGHYMALAPIFLWRLLTMCDPYWDPTRYPMVRSSHMASSLSFILLLGVLVYQYWFWFAHVMPSLGRLSCQQYGFLFGTQTQSSISTSNSSADFASRS